MLLINKLMLHHLIWSLLAPRLLLWNSVRILTGLVSSCMHESSRRNVNHSHKPFLNHMWNIGCFYSCAASFFIITRGPLVGKSIIYKCEMSADMTVCESDATVLHLSCPQREGVTFKPTGGEQAGNHLYFHVHLLWWKEGPATYCMPSAVCWSVCLSVSDHLKTNLTRIIILRTDLFITSSADTSHCVLD